MTTTRTNTVRGLKIANMQREVVVRLVAQYPELMDVESK